MCDRGGQRRAAALRLKPHRARIAAALAFTGAAWGAIAVWLLLAMRAGEVPSPGEAPLPFAAALVALYLPSIVGLSLEALAGRSTIGPTEVIAASIASGVVLASIIAVVARATVLRRWRLLS